MADPFVAEIRIVGFNFAPRGWAFCNGQLVQISQNTALFSLLGTTYGGNGTTTFALPNLQGASPLGAGSGPGLTPRDLGEAGGSSTVTLLSSEMPSHAHTLLASADPSSPTPTSTMALASTTSAKVYRSPSNLVPMATPLDPAGAGLPHDNRQPYLGMNFIIALQGVYPSRP